MRTLAMTRSITGAKVSAVSSTGMPSTCATITVSQSTKQYESLDASPPWRRLWGGGVWAAAHDAAHAHGPRLFRVVRIADVVLFELAGPPAGHVQPAVVDRQVDVA